MLASSLLSRLGALQALPDSEELGQAAGKLSFAGFLIVLTAVIAGGLFWLGMYALYVALTSAGLTLPATLAIVAAFALCGVVICALLVKLQIRNAVDTLRGGFSQPSGSGLEELVLAFINGLTQRRSESADEPQADDPPHSANIVSIHTKE